MAKSKKKSKKKSGKKTALELVRARADEIGTLKSYDDDRMWFDDFGLFDVPDEPVAPYKEIKYALQDLYYALYDSVCYFFKKLFRR